MLTLCDERKQFDQDLKAGLKQSPDEITLILSF